MPLELGTHIGPYEITGTLGAGGMGEGYRTRDTRLKRDVAPKVLSEGFFQLKGRYRFLQGGTHLDISPDGWRFLLIKEGASDEPASAPQIIVVHSWFEELKRLVPAR